MKCINYYDGRNVYECYVYDINYIVHLDSINSSLKY